MRAGGHVFLLDPWVEKADLNYPTFWKISAEALDTFSIEQNDNGVYNPTELVTMLR